MGFFMLDELIFVRIIVAANFTIVNMAVHHVIIEMLRGGKSLFTKVTFDSKT